MTSVALAVVPLDRVMIVASFVTRSPCESGPNHFCLALHLLYSVIRAARIISYLSAPRVISTGSIDQTFLALAT